ncbi:MAG: hypothetical protein QXO30_02790 [Candidatus Caldarchaeum sp.]
MSAAATAYLMYAMTMEPSTAGEERITVYMGEYTPNEVHVRRNVRTLVFSVNGGAYPHNAYLKEDIGACDVSRKLDVRGACVRAGGCLQYPVHGCSSGSCESLRAGNGGWAGC